MRRYFILYSAIICTLLVACTNDDERDVILSSEDEIHFDVSQMKHISDTRSHLYDMDSALFKEEYGGGNFWVNAYPDETSVQYINSRVWWSGKYWFLRKGYETYNCYWPKNNKLNFFAYMPWDLNNSTVTIGSYTYNEGGEFGCNLPLNNTAIGMNQETVSEFMYAFAKDCTKEQGSVQLAFVHPLSAIYFKLKQSHRDVIIHGLGFENIYNKGNYRCGEETATTGDFKDNFKYSLWTPQGDKDTMAIKVEKVVPEDINFNAEIGGPFIVMPQSFAGVNFYIVYTYNGEKKTARVSLDEIHGTSIPNNGWQPGKKYVYSIDLGDSNVEIHLRVSIEEWKSDDFKDIIDIE